MSYALFHVCDSLMLLHVVTVYSLSSLCGIPMNNPTLCYCQFLNNGTIIFVQALGVHSRSYVLDIEVGIEFGDQL